MAGTCMIFTYVPPKSSFFEMNYGLFPKNKLDSAQCPAHAEKKTISSLFVHGYQPYFTLGPEFSNLEKPKTWFIFWKHGLGPFNT